MDITRFDEVEFEVLQCGENGGFYRSGENAERAILLMKEGVFLENPRDNWQKTGWKFTEQGKEYYGVFMKAVREKHGHVWLTKYEKNPDIYNPDDNEVDTFAYSAGYHNGMECKNCGFTFCHHCEDEINIEKCSMAGVK